MISYAILVSDETEEFNKLLTYLIRIKNDSDEIVVVADESKTNDDIKRILKINEALISYYFNPLNNDFASQKNFLFSKCTKDFIVNLDADEFITDEFILNVKQIIDSNPEIEAYWVPRWNEVKGITQEFIHMWRWKIDSSNRINWPDLQMRVVKNTKNIKWIGEVHEQIVGYKTYAVLPLEREYAIAHIKTIEKQIKQNEFYNTIQKNG